MQRHFCVTTYIINPRNGKFLFIRHKKLNKWLPAGGHIEENESPDEAAMREVKEETGLKIEFIGDYLPTGNSLVRPYAIQLNVIKQNEHEHMDIIYLAKPKDDLTTVLNSIETDGLEWYGISEIEKDDFDTFPATKEWCKRFYKIITK